jgi:hypothetical protein
MQMTRLRNKLSACKCDKQKKEKALEEQKAACCHLEAKLAQAHVVIKRQSAQVSELRRQAGALGYTGQDISSEAAGSEVSCVSSHAVLAAQVGIFVARLL